MSRHAGSQTHYQVLDVDPKATPDEIRRSWRSLVLLYHPDKGSSATADGSAEREERLLEVNRAWAVLREPEVRASYDLSLARGSSEARRRQHDRPTHTKPPPPLARTVLSLDDFEAHYDSRRSKGEHETSDEDEEPMHYTHPCRCSALYTITTAQLEDGVDVVGCDGCGDWVRVGYEVVEDADP